MIRVLIVDDHAVVRRGIRQILEETDDIQVAGEAAIAADVLPLVRKQPAEVMVLDINIGDASGLDLLTQIKKERPSLPVIILTVYSEEQYAVRAIRTGASGFLTKASAPESLVAAVRKVATGGRFVTPALAEKLASALSAEQEGAPHESLSNRELQILEMIASGKTVGQIAKALGLSVKTISTHRTHILEKMQMSTNAELTHYAIKRRLVE